MYQGYSKHDFDKVLKTVYSVVGERAITLLISMFSLLTMFLKSRLLQTHLLD